MYYASNGEKCFDERWLTSHYNRFCNALQNVEGEMTRENEILKCQFCGYEGKGWLNKGQTCPKYGKNYDWQLAQDSEE